MRASLRLAALASLLAMPLGAAELDQHGTEHSWKGESGRYTVIDFAASWCGPCWRTLPKLQELAGRHPQLRVLVVSVDDERSGRDQLVEELDLDLPVLWDEGYTIAEHFRPGAMPTTVLLDPQGEEIYRYSGSSDAAWREFSAFVDELPVDQGEAAP